MFSLRDEKGQGMTEYGLTLLLVIGFVFALYVIGWIVGKIIFPSSTGSIDPHYYTPTSTPSPTNTSQPPSDPLQQCMQYQSGCGGDNQSCTEGIAMCEAAFAADPNNPEPLGVLTLLLHGRSLWNPPSFDQDLNGVIKYDDDIMRFATNNNETPICQMLIRLGESYLLLDSNDHRGLIPLQTFQSNNCTFQPERVQCNIETRNPVECIKKFGQ